jgi:outer membrane protein OmpA-like peptidoglycan-associated protein
MCRYQRHDAETFGTAIWTETHDAADKIPIEIAWFGELYPLNENLDETDLRANRRVEIDLEFSM